MSIVIASLVFVSLLLLLSLVMAAVSQGGVRVIWAVTAVVQSICVAVDVFLLAGGF